MNDFDDLSGAQELALGELVAEKFGSDFFFLDRFPSEIRPFYTMPCPDDKRYSAVQRGATYVYRFMRFCPCAEMFSWH